VTNLDDAAALRVADPGGMLDAVLALPDQINDAYELGRATLGLPSAGGLRSIVFCGMGGSAIAGDVIAALFADRVPMPVDVIRRPELPAHCGPDTLVLVSSYSGNTAESLASFEEAVRRGCRILAITSGGELARGADELGIARVRLPQGFEMPRAAFGYLTLAPLGALDALGIGPGLAADVGEAVRALERIAESCSPSVPVPSNPAKSLALRMGERMPVVWGAAGVGAVAAARWKSEWNENAKLPAFAAALPELDHNEVVGWSAGTGGSFFLVALRHRGELPEVGARFPLSIEIARASGMVAEEVWAIGNSALTRLLELVLLGDLTSTYVAIARGVDPSPIEAIARLKRALAQASSSEAVGRGEASSSEATPAGRA
jgi:glucose/mannose-6-phosphate isomerase